MIKIEDIDVWGFKHAIRGMRNPMNSWDKSDSVFCDRYGCGVCEYRENRCYNVVMTDVDVPFGVGGYDLDLMKRLFIGGTEHRKFMRMIHVSMDVTAPLYWWKEYDTYKVGTVANSCSTMHKIHAKEFTLEDFSCEHITEDVSCKAFEHIIEALNFNRFMFIDTKDKKWWWNMIQLLPTSYNQKRTLDFNYEVAVTMIRQRTGHKLDEWNQFVRVLTDLPYMQMIIGAGHEQK